MKGLIMAALCLSAAGLAGAASSPASAAQRVTDTARACESLAGLSVPRDAIGLPTSGARVTSAVLVPAAAAHGDGEYCKVLGRVLPVDPAAPPILFEVNLPANWNGKTLQLGGGGLDGTLVSGLRPPPGHEAGSPAPLALGYVTFGSDSGHEGHAGFDATFAGNSEAFHNFGGDQVKKTHDVALALIRRRYGRAPTHGYFIGGSQGGHEALIAVQRFAGDYDGVVALYPAYNVALLHLGANAFAKALYADGGAGWLDPAKVALLQRAVYGTCDGLDGAMDGIISNLAACQRAFDFATLRAKLRCPGGADTGDSCLSDAQIGAVEKIASPFRLGFALGDGEQTFPKWTILEGAKFLTSLGHSRMPSHPPALSDAVQYLIGDTTVRYIFTGNLGLDSINDFRPEDYRQRILAAARVLDDAKVDISAFRDHGGKLILLHGTADELITPYNTIDYYQRLVQHYGQAALDRFVRFYLVPGYGHGVGIFDARWNPLAVLDAWVTRGQAPGTLTAVDGNRGAHRTRPLCVYPQWPKYDGSGDVNAAASFRCVER
jgi:feruloyl esterase